MTWVKLDDNALDDPDFIRLPRGVRLFHLEALAWSNRHAAGGLIPTEAAVRFTDEKGVSDAANTLVSAGLWELADDGYRILWLLDDQPTPEEIARTRERNRGKQKRHREHLRGNHELCDPKWCKAARNPVSNPVTNRGSNGSPTRPVPTLPEGEGVGTGSDDAGSLAGPVVAKDKRREHARAIREAPSPMLRRRYLNRFVKEYGHLYGHEVAA